MPNQAPTPEDVTVSFVTRVRAHLEADERTVSWLAKRIGMADSTLRWQLDHPEQIRVKTWLAIANALDWSPAELAGIAA